MKKITFPFPKLLIALFIFSGLFASAQTPEQAQKITASYDQIYLQELAAKSLEKSQAEKKAAIEYAQARNIPISYTTKDSAYAELQKVLPDGTLLYYQTDNVNAAKSTRVNHLNTGGSTGYGLDGQNMIAYVWDAGHPRVSHQEYHGPGGNNRVSIMDSPVKRNFHAAHVAGTIMASGVDPAAKGMAPRSKVRTYDWNNDLSEATTAAGNGMLLSNHSYGYKAAEVPNKWFGAYRDDAEEWDNLMFNAPYYLMVNSAGNDGDETFHNGQPLAPGYDMLNGTATAKNNLVIAAAYDANVDNNGNLISVDIIGFSSPGPTDDLRIKPDITGNGSNLYSTYHNSNTAYESISGTSMSAPNVTGSLLLLQEHYNNINGNFMRAATLKGLALHTADDAGPIGPDVKWGWGLLNAKRAAETITHNGSASHIQEMVLNQGQTVTLTVESNGFSDLMASISWTDRPGNFNDGTNSSTAALINDLDIRVKKNTTTYRPWRLTSVTQNGKGDNTKDPYERVDVSNASGTYTITITHKGTLVGGSQRFSLIVTGLHVQCTTASIPQNVLVNDITGSTAEVSWNSTPGTLYDLRYREVGTAIWASISDIPTNNYEITGLEPFTEYEVEMRSKCPEGGPSSYSDPVNFTTDYCESFSSFPDPELYISNVTLNTINNTSTESAYSDFTDISTELIAGQVYNISISVTSNNPGYYTNYSVWIDYNRNGSFNDSGEQVFTMETTAGNEVTGSFTVPSNIDPSSTTMRVTMSNDVGNPSPCEQFTFGEVEDYTIHLRLPYTDFVYENNNWTPENPAEICTADDNILIINGSTSFTTDITANNVTINPGASLGVEKVLNIAGDLTINGELVFISNATGNGELGTISESSTIIGNATVQNYMSSNRAYRLVSSAVTTTSSIHDNWQESATSNIHNPNPGFGTHITGSIIDRENGFDGTATGNPSMYYVSGQSFVAVSSTNGNLQAGNPYLLFVRGDRSIDLTNNLSSGETVLRTTGTLQHGTQNPRYFENVNSGQFAVFGNPYQSTVDVNHLFANGATNVNTEHYYMYDPTQGTHGTMITVVLPGGTNTGSSNANQYLQPGQAAQFTASGNAPSLVFSEANKAPGNFTTTSATNNRLSADNMLTVQLFTTENFNSGGPTHDSFGIIFDDNFDNAITLEDAVKPWNFYENLGIDHDGTYLSIERRKMPQLGEVYPLYSAGYQYSEYTMKLTIDGLSDNLLYLTDHFTGESDLLEVGDTIYSFDIDINDPLSIATDRFSIGLEERLGVIDNNLISNIRLFPNPIEGNSFYIYAPELDGEEMQIKINDILGREIYRNKEIFNGNTLKIIPLKILKSGIYVVHLSNTIRDHTLRLIKN